MRVSKKATLSVYRYGTHRTRGKIRQFNPYWDRVSVVSSNEEVGLPIFERLLEELVKKGAKPGTNIRITITTVAR